MFFNIRQIYFLLSVRLSERWQKMALLVFQRWAVYRQKPNVPFASQLSFYTDAQLLNMRKFCSTFRIVLTI